MFCRERLLATLDVACAAFFVVAILGGLLAAPRIAYLILNGALVPYLQDTALRYTLSMVGAAFTGLAALGLFERLVSRS